MSPGFAILAPILLILQLVLPKPIGFLPLLIAGCHLGNGEIFGDFTIGRALITVGLIRALSGGFFRWTKANKIDYAFLIFSIAALLSSFGHNHNTGNPWNARIGLVLNTFGTYLYARAYLADLPAFLRYARIVPFVLVPLGLAMTVEQATRQNGYYFFGAMSATSVVRDGKVRAQGPFRHPILAGCAGATSLPLAYLLWRQRRRAAGVIGFGACMAVTLACASSGPLAAVAVTVSAAVLWKFRSKLHLLRRAAVVLAALYWIVKGRGPWYLMASIDLVGGSTGWHRAKLFDQGFTYLNEWWLYGTDYTRHWMASGVSWSTDHVDLTNYYLHLGVIGGLPLVGSLVWILVLCFKGLGRHMVAFRHAQDEESEMVLWCAGAALAAHAISFVSISYFDQMYVLFYLLVGAVSSMTDASKPVPQADPETGPPAAEGPLELVPNDQPGAKTREPRYYS